MRTKRRIAILASAGVVMALLIWQVTRPTIARGPLYEGRPLRDCLVDTLSTNPEICARGGRMFTNGVDQVGTNALPMLLAMLKAHDSAAKVKLLALAAHQSIIKIRYVDYRFSIARAAIGFRVLGPRAAPAVPALLDIYEHGPSAENRLGALMAFGYVGAQAAPAVPMLVHDAQDTNSTYRVRYYSTLQVIHGDPDLVVPVFARGLADPYSKVQQISIAALAEYGSDATAAMPALTQYVRKQWNSYPPALRSSSRTMSFDPLKDGLDALRKIDPVKCDELMKELTNTAPSS